MLASLDVRWQRAHASHAIERAGYLTYLPQIRTASATAPLLVATPATPVACTPLQVRLMAAQISLRAKRSSLHRWHPRGKFEKQAHKTWMKGII